MPEKTFASNLARAMRKAEMTQVALAKKSGIKQQLISSYIRKSRMAQYPSLRNLMRLAKALECTVDELLGLSSLKGQAGDSTIEERRSKLALQLAEVYDRLPKGDWRREAVKYILLSVGK
jgi:transcriptional regulator with XRE-family HTH domain